MSEANESEKDFIVLYSLRNWLHAIFIQGERVFRNYSDREISNRSESAELLRIMDFPDQHFFLIAANKCLEYIAQAVNRKLVDNKCFIPMWTATGKSLKRVRDMREHDVEYLIKRVGKKQSDFVRCLPGCLGVVDASSTIVADGKYLIAGLVDVAAVMEAARALTPLVEMEIEVFKRHRYAQFYV